MQEGVCPAGQEKIDDSITEAFDILGLQSEEKRSSFNQFAEVKRYTRQGYTLKTCLSNSTDPAQ